MKRTLVCAIVLSTCLGEAARGDGTVVFSGERRRNNLVSELLEVSAVAKSGNSFRFTRPVEGWIFVSAACQGRGKLTILLDDAPGAEPVVLHDAGAGPRGPVWPGADVQLRGDPALSRMTATFSRLAANRAACGSRRAVRAGAGAGAPGPT